MGCLSRTSTFRVLHLFYQTRGLACPFHGSRALFPVELAIQGVTDMDGLDQIHLKIGVTASLRIQFQGVNSCSLRQALSLMEDCHIFPQKGQQVNGLFVLNAWGRAFN